MEDDKKPDSPPEENPLEKQMQELLTRVGYIENVLREQLSRLYEIEMRLGITPPKFKPQPTAPPSPRPLPTQPPTPAAPPERLRPESPVNPQASQPETRPPQQPPWRPPAQTAPPAAPPADYMQQFNQRAAQQVRPASSLNLPPRPPAGVPPPRKSSNLEMQIGGTIAKFVGAVAIIFAAIFGVKTAYENGLITPTLLVLLIAAAGIGFLGTGERLRKKYPNYAYALSGLGVALLYISVYASFNVYQLLSQPVAMGCMSLITATAAILSARYTAISIAILALIGGFLTPILVPTGVDNETGLFSYIALLDAGVLALAFTKQWRVLNYLAFVGTVLMVAAWMLSNYTSEKLTPTIFFLTLFFIIFALLAILYNVMNRRPTRWLDLALVFTNALLYFGTSYALLNDDVYSGRYHAYLGAFAVAMSIFYGLLGYFTYRRDSQDRLLILTFGGLTFLFLVLAVPIQFKQQWVTMAWAIEGAVMTWVGLRAKDKTSLYASLCLFGIAAFHWFMIDVPAFGYAEGSTFTPLLNPRAFSGFVLIAALAVSAWLYKKFGAHLSDDERWMFNGIYLLGANAFAITLLSLDVSSYFDWKRAQAGDSNAISAIGNTHFFTLTALWAMYGAVMLFVGVTRRLRVLRVTALVLLGITSIAVLLQGIAFYSADWHHTIFNETFASFLCLIVALALSAWWYWRSESVTTTEYSLVLPMLVTAASLLGVVALSMEVLGHYDRLQKALTGEEEVLENTKQFILTVLWCIYAMAALLIGFKRQAQAVRFGALILLALAIIKLMFADLRFYNSSAHHLLFNYTFGAFLCVIASMALAVWLYASSETIEAEERTGIIPVLMVVANALALVALSAEAWGFFDKQFKPEISGEEASTLRLKQQLSISLIWTIYGGVLLTLGMARRSLLLRVMALLLLGVSTFKVFIFDVRSLSTLYRSISFLMLGAILLGVSFLYLKFRGRFFDTGEEGKEGAEPINEAS
jgi:uncharacterized membrane protein